MAEQIAEKVNAEEIETQAVEITYTFVDRILNTLPLSFYLGRDIKVTLDETGKDSYYDMLKDEITISYPCMAPMLKNVVSDYDREGVVRGILYHEISHAMWSPRNLMQGLDYLYSQVMNVFCDERIENYNANVFMNVNFKRNVILLNDWHGEEPESGFQEFYHAVRFRQCSDEINRKINNIIARYEDIKNMDTESNYYYSDYSYRDTYRIKDYQREVRNLFIEICKDWLEKNKKDELDKKAKEMTGGGSGMGGKSYDSLSSSEKEKVIEKVLEEEGPDETYAGVGKAGDMGDPTSKVEKGAMIGGKWHLPNYENTLDAEREVERMSQEGRNATNELDKSHVQEMLNTMLNKFVDDTLTQKIDMIFMNFMARTRNNGTATERYSGILDPRLLATRDDWRIWKYKADKGNIKGFDKLHLNLFIDTSGSYGSNEEATNTILKSLTTLEQKRNFFTFDLVTMQRGEKLRNKDERYIRTGGGNDLDDNIHKIYQKLQKPDAFNYNIVLFDGDAFTDTPRGQYEAHHANFSAFNNHKTSIISDTDNKDAIKKYAPQAHTVLVGYNTRESYSELLYDNILNAIHRALL